MNPINAVMPSGSSGAVNALDLSTSPQTLKTVGAGGTDEQKTAEAARQFEAILLRQFLSESMKPLLQGGPSGQVYGYLLTDSLADTMTKAGGLGLSNILQAQLTQ